MTKPTWKRIAVATLGTWMVLPALWAGAQSIGQPGRPTLVVTDDAENGVRNAKDQALAQRDVSANPKAKSAKVATPGAIVIPPTTVVNSTAKHLPNQPEVQRGR
jgi:hypothetical protein